MTSFMGKYEETIFSRYALIFAFFMENEIYNRVRKRLECKQEAVITFSISPY